MITVTVRRTLDGWITRFTASGHSGYAEAGSDIICAAVSAMAAEAIGSLQELACIDPERQLETGLIDFQLPEPSTITEQQRQVAGVLTDALVIGCKQIQDSYGSHYIRFKKSVSKGGAKA